MTGGVEELIEMLYNMVQDAKNLPFGSDKCVLERDKVLDLIEEIRAQMPAEISDAKALISSRTEYIMNAKREAESIKKLAEEQARQMVVESEIFRMSKQKSREMLVNAEKRSKELRRGANAYVDDAMKRTEEALAEALTEIKKSRAQFRQGISSSPEAVALPEEEIK